MFLWLAIKGVDAMLTKCQLLAMAVGLASFGITWFAFMCSVVIRKIRNGDEDW